MDIIASVILAILFAWLLILLLDWLGGAIGIPGQIIQVLKIIVVVLLILRLFGMLI